MACFVPVAVSNLKSILNVVVFTIFLASPQMLSACAVCFGGGDMNLTRGFTWGVAILLFLPFVLIGGFVSVVAYHVRKKKHHA